MECVGQWLAVLASGIEHISDWAFPFEVGWVGDVFDPHVFMSTGNFHRVVICKLDRLIRLLIVIEIIQVECDGLGFSCFLFLMAEL